MHIKIDLKIFAFIFIFLLTSKIEIYAMIMLYAFIHELGHLICGIVLGFKPQSIMIMPYGFKLEFKVNYDDYNKKFLNANLLTIKKILIHIAGPLVNILIVIMCIILKIRNENIMYANILIAIFNLIPIFPLDGGKILQELLHIFCGLRKSIKYIQLISIINLAIVTAIASVLIIIYKNITIPIVVFYLWYEVIKSNRFFEMREKIYLNIEKY